MKNKIFALLALVAALFSLSSCEKDLMDFQGEDCLYFDVRRGASWTDANVWAHYTYSEVTFGNIVNNDTTLSFRINATGDVKDYDRPFQVIVTDSTNLEAGTEYEPLKSEYVIKAGERGTNVDITFHRSERMDGDTLRLQLEILPNKYFALKFDSYGDWPKAYQPSFPTPEFNKNNNARFHNIYIDDVLTQPEGWWGTTDGGLWGAFSSKKFKYIMEVTGTNINDFTRAKMPQSRATVISQKVAKALLERAAAKDPVIDEKGTMMWVSYVITYGAQTGSQWYASTTPEQYYKNR